MNKYDFRILIADDEEGMRKIFIKTLAIEGFSVDAVDNGKEAIKRLKSKQYNLAFIDLILPDINGVEIIKNIDTDNIIAVIVTAFATVETAVNAMKFGASDYIKKPFDIKDIISTAYRFYDKKNSYKIPGSEKIVKRKLIYKSKQMVDIVKCVNKIKDHDIPVLITGESGTGKEMIARLIHEKGNRKNKPLIPINCTAIPSELLENELFGHEKGAFTGANTKKPGKFEIAGDGIILLDEIGDMNIKLQSKLLRVIEEKLFESIGGLISIPLKARLIAITNKNINNLINNKEFRVDLYYRLNGIRIHIPPLRERKEDIEPLINYFIDYYKNFYKKWDIEISTEAYKFLNNYCWSGNIREMKNAIESAVLLSSNKKVLMANDFPINISYNNRKSELNEIERESIIGALIRYNFNRSLKISRRTLYNKMKKYSIE